MLVDIDWVESQRKQKQQINEVDIHGITWMKDGKEVEFLPKHVKQFALTGLCNTDIVGMFPYKEKKVGQNDR